MSCLRQHVLFLSALGLFALFNTGCWGEKATIWDLACERDADCVIKPVPVCDACAGGGGDQTTMSRCVPKDYEPPDRISCKLMSGNICAGYQRVNACFCESGGPGDTPDEAPERHCVGVADAGTRN